MQKRNLARLVSSTLASKSPSVSACSGAVVLLRRWFQKSTTPNYAAKGKGGGGSAAKSKNEKSAKDEETTKNAEEGGGGMSLTHCTGLNYFKDGEDPKLLPDEEYPDWLWELARPPMKVPDYEKKKQEYIAEHEEESDWTVAFTFEGMRKWRKLVRRAKIKANNAARAKK